ncbi:signal transduction histidine kinase [Loktanella ponticola]|uniref:histidine kinase n=1 Tax=Yoonia ponticola TaxID=1524255 RepID=A0A7W9BJY5_9RHOB|nr:ATP-binding protein [Yoonia ponticola]MBB5721860.1 signal transduction histidine kinase [Yoonia ponticola]
MIHMDTRLNANAPQNEGRRPFVGVILLLVVLFIAGVAYLVRSDYKRSISEAEVQLVNFAELFEQSVESNLAVANLQMWNLIDRLPSRRFGTSADIETRYGDMMRQTLEQIDQIDSLVWIATNGNPVWSSVEQLTGTYLGDRAYFQEALQLGMNEYAVGVPIIARGTGRRLTPIAWPMVSQSNQVFGVIVSSLGEKYFSDILTLSEIPTDMHVNVVASNGAAAFESEDLSPIAFERNIHASRKIAALDLTINVSRSKSAVLAGFYMRTASFIIIASILFASSIGMAIRLQRKSVQLADGLSQSVQDNLRIVAAQREFNAIFENVADGIVIFTMDGKLKRTNKMARKILGQDDSDQAVADLKRLLPDLSILTDDLPPQEILTCNDQAVECRVMKLTANNMEIAYCVLTDVTAEKRLAAAKDNFVTSINHELRTPLTSLSGSLDLLQDRFADDLAGPAKRLVMMASRNADRLLMLVNDILTLQAIDQGQFHVRVKPVDVSVALEEAVAFNSGYGMGSGVSLLCERTEPGMIFVDPDRLQQIFSNLISNAVKYSTANGTVKIGAVETNGDITFYVRDDGPGIPKSARGRLFDRFTAPIHTSGVQMNGTGLGLAITKQLVERQGGEITLDSRTEEDGAVETGTVFFVTFKMHTAPTTPVEIEA